MKRFIIFNIVLFIVLSMTSCQSEKADASALLEDVHKQYDSGNYVKCLALIDSLRATFPEELSARREALKVFQQASLAIAQQDLARTDSALKVTEQSLNALTATVEAHRRALCATEEELSNLNFMRKKRDSLQVAYDVECAKIRYIHKRQKQENTQ